MDERLKEALDHFKIYGFIPKDMQKIVIDHFTLLLATPEGLPEKWLRAKNEEFKRLYYEEQQKRIAVEAELEQVTLKISELQNSDNLRREQLEEVRKFDCWKWLLSWLKNYDELNKTDIGDKIYQWIQAQPMTQG